MKLAEGNSMQHLLTITTLLKTTKRAIIHWASTLGEILYLKNDTTNIKFGV